MTENTLTLKLDGEVSLASFLDAMQRFKDLVDSLAQEVTPDTAITWVVAELAAGSAAVTVRGETTSDEARDDLRRVVHAYEIVGRSLQDNTVIPYSPRVQRTAQGLLSVLANGITAIHLQTEREDMTVLPGRAPEEPERSASYGVVEGRVLSIMSRPQLRFTLYDTLQDRAVTCYLQEGREDEVRYAWGKHAIVEGWVSRDPFTGHPETIRDVGTIRIIEEVHSGFERARGAAPRGPKAPRAEEAIRRVRDAW